MNGASSMDLRDSSQKRNIRLGLALGLWVVVYVAAVMLFLVFTKR